MPLVSVIRLTFLIAFISALATPSVAEEYIYLNGKPCGAFCRAWMGVELPAHRDNFTASDDAAPSDDSAASGSAASSASERASRAASANGTVAAPPPRRNKSAKTHRQARKNSSRLAETRSTSLDSSAPGPLPAGASTAAPISPAPAKSLGASAIPTSDRMPSTMSKAALDAPSRRVSTIDFGSTDLPKSGDRASARVEDPVPGPARAGTTSDVAPTAPSVAEPNESASASTAWPAVESDSADGPSLSPARGDDNSTPGTKLAVARATPAVLIVLAGPSVTEARDLNDKPVVIAGLSTISRADIGAALAAAGAGAAELTEGRKSDIDQLIGGQVSAAVVAFLSPAKAAEFPEIPGFTLLRIVVADPHGG